MVERESNEASTSRHSHNLARSESKTNHIDPHPLPRDAPIEPGHSMSTGMQLVTDQVEKAHHHGQGVEDDYGHLFVMKRLKRDIPLPGRWTLFIML
jgi:hypothetical protein